jgi:hypothetical protein
VQDEASHHGQKIDATALKRSPCDLKKCLH